jgi:hypothetical protein
MPINRGVSRGEEIETTLHPLFTTLHLIIYKDKKDDYY